MSARTSFLGSHMKCFDCFQTKIGVNFLDLFLKLFLSLFLRDVTVSGADYHAADLIDSIVLGSTCPNVINDQ